MGGIPLSWSAAVNGGNYMTSEERREVRYQRRKAKREEQKRKRNLMTYEEVFSFNNIYSE